MKFLIFLFLPVFSFAQSKLDTISILNGKVKILAPKELSPMSDEMWKVKYRNTNKPTLILSDENGSVNLIGDLSNQSASEDQLASFKDFQFQQLKAKRPDLKLLNEGVKTVNGKKVAYFKFLSQAIDQKVFNYYFFSIVDAVVHPNIVAISVISLCVILS